ncbi:MAG TPA: YcgN family cysteine cluster protein [Sedimenticola sp.]|nr:YcgN family cysteine cluster protein [Sedimenticola sp.]
MERPQAFWKVKPLDALSREEWEALCDGCAKCCLHRFEDRKTRQIHYTNVCCRYLDQTSCRCSDYPNRSRNVPECCTVTLEILEDPYWLPESCAYRLLAEGRELPWWHPLVSGDPATVETSGNRVCGRVVSELESGVLEQHLIDWIR